MAEYVDLRSSAMTLRAIGDQARAVPEQFQVFQPKIVGGTPAGAADNPFQVALLTKSIANNAQAQYCGGTLIAATVVVTAAHCSDFVQAAAVQVLSGSRKLDGTGTRTNVSSVKVHPSWNAKTFDNDVAVWRLSTPVTGIPFATLASDDGAIGDPLLATGWGALKESGSGSIDLMKVPVPLVATSNCNDANSYNGAITGTMICAGLEQGGKDTCQGDSGGPLTRGNNNAVLTGITSWGRGCARPNYFGVYTKVSAAGIKSFIESNSR